MIKIDMRKTMLNICMFLILLYPFNCSIGELFYPNNYVCLGSVFIGIAGIFLLNKDTKLTKNSFLILLVSIVVMFISSINNHYLDNGQEMKVAMFLLYLILPFAIYLNKESLTSFSKIIKWFFAEHIIATFIGIFFKSFYRENILSLICKGKSYCIAAGNYYHGYIPGITVQFSTNAIYLSISSLYLYSEYLVTKKKSTLFFLVLSIIALATTGKRAHLIFTIFCCIALYLYNKTTKKIAGIKVLKLAGIAVLTIGGMLALSNYIPEIMNVVNRFISLIEAGDLLNRRGSLYDLALVLWNRHPIIGNGWGAFSSAYQLLSYGSGQVAFMDAHNVYLQLLAETGIIGFIFFMAIMATVFLRSAKLVKKVDENKDEKYEIIKKFCFAFQLFFLLYCFTGNPLYDPQCYVIYFMTIGYVLALTKNYKRREKDEESRSDNIL